ncbi:MAG: hypothetical protein HYV02_03320 [Deltaproteobacteria bacterium]|nr:hypothetical protein [Deltaproteobacteria bacterium]
MRFFSMLLSVVIMGLACNNPSTPTGADDDPPGEGTSSLQGALNNAPLQSPVEVTGYYEDFTFAGKATQELTVTIGFAENEAMTFLIFMKILDPASLQTGTHAATTLSWIMRQWVPMENGGMYVTDSVESNVSGTVQIDSVTLSPVTDFNPCTTQPEIGRITGSVDVRGTFSYTPAGAALFPSTMQLNGPFSVDVKQFGSCVQASGV